MIDPSAASEQTKEKSERVPRGVAPLALKLSDAMAVAHRVNEAASGRANYDLFSQLIGNTKTSSSFQRKVAALRSYGIIEDQDNVVVLSELGNRLTSPRDERDDALAAKEAMLRIDLLARMFERHRGRLLPEDTFLNNILIQEFKVPREVSRTWVDHFKDALNSSKLSFVRSDGRTQVTDDPLPNHREALKAAGANTLSAADPKESAVSVPEGKEESPGQFLPIPLGRGRIARLSLPADWSAKRDLNRLLRMLELSLSEDEEQEESVDLK